MQPITQLPPLFHLPDQCVKRSSLSLIADNLFSDITLIALRLAACVCNILQQKGLGSFFAYKARKIHSLYVLNNISNENSPLPTLTYAKNHASLAVICNEEDVASIRAMRDALLTKHPDSEFTDDLQNMHIKGAKEYGGICGGATQLVLKTCLESDITSQNDLICVLKGFENGFAAEAVGMQAIACKIYKIMKVSLNISETDLLNPTNAIDKLKANLSNSRDQITTFSQCKSEEEFAQAAIKIIERLDNLKSAIKKVECSIATLEAYYQYFYNYLPALLGLQVQNEWDSIAEGFFKNFDTDEAAKQRFDNLSSGVYYLRIDTDSGRGHAIAYLKYRFGSYLLDPNYGLMPCTNSASDALITIYKHYKTEGPYNLLACRYGLLLQKA